MRKKIFRTFLGLSLGLFFIMLVAAIFIHQVLKTQNEIKHLNNFSFMLKSALEYHGHDFLQQLKSDAYRITLISPDGTVIFDNMANKDHMDNHLTREEITAAIADGEGNTLRYSDTLHKETYYHAIKLQNGNILRLSFTSNSLFAYTQTFTLFFVVVFICVCTLCYYVATRLANALIEPINDIKLDDMLSITEPLEHSYEELHPFLWRIFIQQRKIDEQLDELRLKNNEFQAITKSMSDGLVILNAQGIIVSINKTARRIFAVTKDNCLNQSYLAIDNSQYMHDMMANSATQPKQSMNIVRDGRDFEVRFSKINDNGTCVGYVLIILDVTEKKRTEQLRQEFTANVSHELKTPLQSIIGYSELMASGFVQSEDIKHFAARIHKQSTRLKSLIEDIIFLSHLDEGQIANMEEISVRKICDEVFEALQEKALERLVRLAVRGPDLHFIAVNRYIYELIYNLVDNAIRYNKENGRITITLHETNNKYVIAVEDTGIGIAPEDQFRIFERFYRVDKSHSRQTGGTGLGLSIVKRVVLYHHGKIRLSSKLGVGSTFTISFYKNKLQEMLEQNKKKQEEWQQEQAKNGGAIQMTSLTAASFRAAEDASRQEQAQHSYLHAAEAEAVASAPPAPDAATPTADAAADSDTLAAAAAADDTTAVTQSSSRT